MHNTQVLVSPLAPLELPGPAFAMAMTTNVEQNKVIAYYEDFGEMYDRGPTVSQTACVVIL